MAFKTVEQGYRFWQPIHDQDAAESERYERQQRAAWSCKPVRKSA